MDILLSGFCALATLLLLIHPALQSVIKPRTLVGFPQTQNKNRKKTDFFGVEE